MSVPSTPSAKGSAPPLKHIFEWFLFYFGTMMKPFKSRSSTNGAAAERVPGAHGRSRIPRCGHPISRGWGMNAGHRKVGYGGMLSQPRGDHRAGYEGIPVPLSHIPLVGMAARLCVCVTGLRGRRTRTGH
eukprot:2902600-Prymnesium_polylepis.1